MKKCNADDHPYCTFRLEDGATVCAAGHTQKIVMAEAMDNPSRLPGYAQLTGNLAGNLPDASASRPLHLHFSGYDPRAAGGRQMIKLELRGSIPEDIAQIEVQLCSELIAAGVMVQRFERSLAGLWRPLLIAFSSKNKDYGQYQLEVELKQSNDGTNTEDQQRRWTCSTIILIPPTGTSLTEIHRVFLGSQKNVKVFADDGSIAKLSGLNSDMHGNMDIEVSAKNAALTQVEFSAPVGKYEIALGSIAWDEELIEEAPAITSNPVLDLRPHVENKTHASLICRDLQAPRQIRLLAFDHWVLGRLELHHPSADVLLAHRGKSSAENAQLTRRISASHAIIRRTDCGAELIDVSRYGTLLDGLALIRDQPTPLKAGMHIELCASIKGIACLKVLAVLPHAIILQRSDSNGDDAEIFYLLTPETRPDLSVPYPTAGLPLLFHFAGNFWHTDPQTKQETLLAPSIELNTLPGIRSRSRYSNNAYDDVNVRGFGLWRLASTAMPITTTTELLGKRP